jgi:hypothetical protein
MGNRWGHAGRFCDLIEKKDDTFIRRANLRRSVKSLPTMERRDWVEMGTEKKDTKNDKTKPLTY